MLNIFNPTIMEKDFILQNLCDAFEVLKDSWDSKSDAICKCIAETAKYDMSTALDMWSYLLVSHKKYWRDNLGAEIIQKVSDKFYYSYDDHLRGAVCHICPVLINKQDLYNILFGKVIVKDDFDQTNFLVCVFAWILGEKNPNLVLDLLHLYNNNPHKEFSIGSFLSKSVEAHDYFNRNYGRNIPVENKEVLMSFLENIKDKKERAECMVAILSL